MKKSFLATDETAKHTPGPWVEGRPDMGTLVDGVTSKWIYAGDQYVAVASGRIAGSWDEVIANSRLIAASPEMLDLLVAAKNGFYAGWDDTEWWARVNAVIAKVQGDKQ